MKAVILAGGMGTRISEETHLKPKPMIEIGAKPIIWHVMKIYSHYGINDFIICCGYKGYIIKEYFANYFLHMSDVTFDMTTNEMHVHHRNAEPWKITVVDTGLETMTGGRIKRIQKYVGDEDFCMTYGDGVADVDVSKLVAFHTEHGCAATMTAITPPGRYGALQMSEKDENKVSSFIEKPPGDGMLNNGGFFVLSSRIFDYIENDKTIWEQQPLRKLAKDNELAAYRHRGFWHPMDTLRDKIYLDQLWEDKTAPWKTW